MSEHWWPCSWILLLEGKTTGNKRFNKKCSRSSRMYEHEQWNANYFFYISSIILDMKSKLLGLLKKLRSTVKMLKI